MILSLRKTKMAQSNSIKSSRPNQDNHKGLKGHNPVLSGLPLPVPRRPLLQLLLQFALELGLRAPLPR